MIVFNGKSYLNGWFGGTTIYGNPYVCRCNRMETCASKKKEKSSRSCSILGHKQYPASWFQVRVVFLFEMCFTHQFPFVHMEMSILGGFPSQPCLIPYPPEASNLRLIAAHGRKHTTVRPRKTSSGAFWKSWNFHGEDWWKVTNTMINTMVQGFLVTISMAKLWIWVASLLDKAMPQASATNRWLVTSFNIVWDDDHCTARW